MDFEDDPDTAAYRAEVRAWLAANAPRPEESAEWQTEAGLLRAARAWQARKAAGGYAAITVPRAYGGSGLSPSRMVVYRQEEARFRVPFGVYEIGLGMCVPTLLALGSPGICERHVPPAVSGREIWCQLFSEPAAGSDLAALRTRAERTDRGWVVNGQKVWTTGAQFSDFGLLLARTDPGVPKHAGLTLFILDMRSAGVEVRPIRQMSGGAEFNEVFLTDVFIPDEQRLTPPGEGWKGARITLMFERLNVGGDIGLMDHRGVLARSRGLAIDGRPAVEDPSFRERLARWHVADRGLKLLNFRTLTALGKGETPGPEQSIAKLVIASQAQEMANYLLDLRDEEGALCGDALGADWAPVERAWSMGAGMRIAGGTDEILRNIIAERVLGLPAEPRFDLGAPFDQASS